MINERKDVFFAFLVHAYLDNRRNRLYLLGRLADGRSFAAVEENWRPYIHIYESARSRALPLLGALKFEETAALESFSGAEKLLCLKFFDYSSRYRAAAALEGAHISSPDAGIKPADLFLIEKQIRGYVCIKGSVQPGKRVAVIIRNPEISALEQAVPIPLRLASVDIETDVSSGVIRAVSAAWVDATSGKIIDSEICGKVRVLSGAGNVERGKEDGVLIFHNDEKSMLSAFNEDISAIDPDVLTGWNFLDFDFPHLAERFERLGLRFTLGRSHDSAKFFPGDDDGGSYWHRRSSAAIVPGRQVLDALRVMRAGVQSRTAGMSFSLEDVAQRVLGEGKTVHETGDEKIAALDRLYAQTPVLFGEYCLRDAQLVLMILAKTGLFRLTLERASLTGVSLDKAWTSVVSFERIYGMQLRRNGIAPPPPDIADVSGAAGGTVLDPEPGLFNNVAVFDFRSLYPTIMRTFNIDPFSHARAGKSRGKQDEQTIVAPNGAVFSRKPGLLPALIAEYFATRRLALENGDEIAAQVYKILMNSFYGVLGTSACRYGKTKLAGAITSFARKWLLFSKDWFNSRGLRVLYGDTDSLFVETGLQDSAALAEFESCCARLAKEINLLIAETVKKEYDLESFIELRFEKAYRRFIIPPIRNFHAGEDSGDTDESGTVRESRGRAKGYGGYLLQPDGSAVVEVKGMEAVRSDATPLARRLQLELLELVFSGCTEDEFRERVGQTVCELRSGALDNELVYRKRLTRYPETYTSSTPPQVKAARALGWKKRRGTVEYLWTENGPEPTALPHGKLDYDHYVESQVFPLVRSIASAAKWDAGFFVTRKGGASHDDAEMQMELFG
ncbi:MAG: DNA polymerase II [Treponema sp.]|jgi:DNA polymerase-2|nr:DNA polymerase II [Treponema sp.]